METGGIDGLSVTTGFTSAGEFEIAGMHFGGGAIVGRDDYEYVITVGAEGLPALAAALACDIDGIQAAWDARQDEIVRRGEHRWLNEHNVPNSLWTA
jgi:hypothetical protein